MTEKQSDSETIQVNQYDKILKENMESALPGLIRKVLGIEVIRSEEIPDDVQHTKERKPDVLKKVTDRQGKTFILHIEFQVKDESEMEYRMVEYLIMLSRKYKLPVKQYVIYIGENRLRKMKGHLTLEQLTYKYQLLPLSKIDYRLFLKSASVEENIIALLGSFGDESPKIAFQNIVAQIVKKEKGTLALERRLRQLRIMANLRKLALKNINYMDSIAKYMKKEDDILYRLGAKETKTEIVKKLLAEGHFSVLKIAEIVGVSLSFVNRLKSA